MVFNNDGNKGRLNVIKLNIHNSRSFITLIVIFTAMMDGISFAMYENRQHIWA